MKSFVHFGHNINTVTSQSAKLFEKKKEQLLKKFEEALDKIAPNDPIYNDVSEVVETLKFFNDFALRIAEEILQREHPIASQGVT